MGKSIIKRRDVLYSIGAVFTLMGCSPKSPSPSNNSPPSMANDFKAIVDLLAPWRKQHMRKAFRPITKAGKSTEVVSRFGGVPLLGAENDWPLCGRCSRPLSLLLQLDLATIPNSKAPLNSGVLQVFYCTRMDYDTNAFMDIDTSKFCNDYRPFSACHHLRVIQDSQLSQPSVSKPGHIFPQIDIVGWEQFDDFPSGMEHDRLGLRYDYDFTSTDTPVGAHSVGVHWDKGNVHFSDVECTNDAEGNLAGAIASAAPKDKLFGWPMWIQGVEYPSCPRCEREMEYLFQIDSEDNVPHMFGDVGCGHVSYCPEHPDVLAFTWACS